MNSVMNKWKLLQHSNFKIMCKTGTILTTTASIIIVDYFKVPNPAIICLIGIVFSAFIGGYIYGAISGVLTLVYCMYFFSNDHSFFFYKSENAYKIIVILVALIAMVFMVGTLKKTVEKRTNDLLILNEKFMKLSIIDELTGLYNYRYL